MQVHNNVKVPTYNKEITHRRISSQQYLIWWKILFVFCLKALCFLQLIIVIVAQSVLCLTAAGLGLKQSLTRPPGAVPCGSQTVPALVQSPPAEASQSASQQLGGELRKVSQETEKQKDPQPKEENTEQEEDSQRGIRDPPEAQIRAKHSCFLHQQQAAKAQEENVF